MEMWDRIFYKFHFYRKRMDIFEIAGAVLGGSLMALCLPTTRTAQYITTRRGFIRNMSIRDVRLK